MRKIKEDPAFAHFPPAPENGARSLFLLSFLGTGWERGFLTLRRGKPQAKPGRRSVPGCIPTQERWNDEKRSPLNSIGPGRSIELTEKPFTFK